LETVLAEAQQRGYAEADPTADVEGFDARSKLALLAALAFGIHVRPADIPTEGILRVRDVDFLYAKRIGRTVRLIASAEETDAGLLLAVRPALVPTSAILAHVSGAYNAVWVRGAHGADTFYYGRGAGPTPTGVAVVSDIMNVARELANGGSLRVSPFAYEALEQASPGAIEDEVRSYYLMFRVRDRPGIIADLAGILASSLASIDAVLQEPSADKDDLPFVITLEPAPRRAVLEAVARMSALEFLIDRPLALPMLDGFAG
jgi:homoserine dehydrogenase